MYCHLDVEESLPRESVSPGCDGWSLFDHVLCRASLWAWIRLREPVLAMVRPGKCARLGHQYLPSGHQRRGSVAGTEIVVPQGGSTVPLQRRFGEEK